jgi:hypothetical protein
MITKMINEPNAPNTMMEDQNLLVGARKVMPISSYEEIVAREVCHGQAKLQNYTVLRNG